MALQTSKAGTYVVEGQPDAPRYASKLGQYVVEGQDHLLYAAKLGVYVVEGPPPIIPPATRRRQMHMP